MSAEGQLIHLFTSNIRELYISDAIDLLAAPPGFVYKFRYERKHVQDQLFSQWHSGDDGIVGTRVIAYHSLQHPANFHRAAYVPLRFGRVIDAAIEGSICTLKFRLEEYAPLPDPDSIEHERLDTIVQDFSEKLRDLLKPYYPDYTGETGRDDRRSATLGPSPAD